jgi:hypothetical protein
LYLDRTGCAWRYLPADFPPLRSLATFAHNLPVQLTRFIGRLGQRGRDFLAEKLAIATAEPMGSDASSTFGGAQAGSDRYVRVNIGVAGEQATKRLEGRGFAGFVVLSAELVEDPPQERQCPTPVEDPFRSELVAKFP